MIPRGLSQRVYLLNASFLPNTQRSAAIIMTVPNRDGEAVDAIDLPSTPSLLSVKNGRYPLTSTQTHSLLDPSLLGPGKPGEAAVRLR